MVRASGGVRDPDQIEQGAKRAMGVGLHMYVDGCDLATRRSFVNCVRLKGNPTYTKAGAARGQPDMPVRCDACQRIESLAHILQKCPRCDRHDAVNKYLDARWVG